METLSGKELDDSIFGADSNLDWADEVTMTEFLHGDPFNSGGNIDNNNNDTPARPGTSTSTRANNDGNRGSRDNTRYSGNARQQQQQQGGRQSRQGVRPARSNADMNSGYNNNHGTTGGSYGGGSARGDYRGGRGGRGGSRGRGGRGASTSGGRGGYYQQQQQQSYAQTPTAPSMPMGGGGQQRRGSRDRSLSAERSGSMERPRVWRGGSTPSYGNRNRADMADRWEHDRYEHSSGHQPLGRPRTHSSERREVDSLEVGSPTSIQHIGKEGIAHVTIHRRGSSGSSRHYGFGNSPEDNGGSSVVYQPMQNQLRRRSSGLNPTSPRSPTAPGSEPYRAPHRRQNSGDNNLQQQQQQQQQRRRPISGDSTAPTGQHAPSSMGAATEAQSAATIMETEEEESAVMEWENFVDNGGLDMPFESITDDLLKQKVSRVRSQPKSGSSNTSAGSRAAVGSIDDMGASNSRVAATRGKRQPQVLALDDDDDDDLSDDAALDAYENEAGRRQAQQQQQQQRRQDQGISIRGSAKKQSSQHPSSRVDNNGMASLVLDQVVSPRTRRPSVPISERASQNNATKTLQGSGSGNSVGIRIKGTTSSTANGNSSSASTSEPRMPSAPMAPGSGRRSCTPTKPATPTPSSRLSSRSSSREERAAKSMASTPSTYLRRQHEGYDEDRGRHLFSVNVAYDEGRYAPIHVHEKDNVANLASKFARTWRVHNKELRIKTVLTKVKALMQDSPL
ncbi:hypothetical protein GQ54DRAFT_310838 [Martensiomyces pterosporus]|nr:hypothetical protein GQ54DRAFT_310838 [Martensiomyces pterosporus]